MQELRIDQFLGPVSGVVHVRRSQVAEEAAIVIVDLAPGEVRLGLEGADALGGD